MARKSRRKITEEQPRNRSEGAKLYHAALYARNSVENERKRQADTIGTQIELLETYAQQQPDIIVQGIYCDDDYSGANMDRPELKRMMGNVQAGAVDCIIVKDLSRFVRNFLEAGEYLERWLPDRNVRFIAINDHLDTSLDSIDLSVQVKNLANEMYSKDISRKIQSTKLTHQHQGKITGGSIPYGYRRDPADKSHLIPDTETRSVVREMFEMISRGETMRCIATTLNRRGVPSPGRLKYLRGEDKRENFASAQWYQGTVKNILQNPVYLGWVVGGQYKSQYLDRGEKKSERQEEDQWVVVKGMHEPLVSEELYHAAQAYIAALNVERARVARYDSKNRRENLFRGILRCGECGKAMTFRQKAQKPYYCCALHDHYGRDYCVKKSVQAEKLETMTLKMIHGHMALYVEAKNVIAQMNATAQSQKTTHVFEEQLSQVRQQLQRYSVLKAGLFQDYQDGVITRQDFAEMSGAYTEKVSELRLFADELEKVAQRYRKDETEKTTMDVLVDQYMERSALTRDMVESFLTSMTLYEDGRVEVTFACQSDFDRIVYEAAARQKEGV